MKKFEEKKKYNLSLARAYKTKLGYWSTDIGAEEFDALQKIELGGRLVIQILTDEQRKKDTSPHAYFQFMSKEDVEKFKKFREEQDKKSDY